MIELIRTAWTDPLSAPITAMVILAFAPNMVFRAMGVFLSRGLDEDSEALAFVRAVATALLAGVVGKVLASPPGALADAPAWGRVVALAAGVGAFYLFRKSLWAGLITGVATLGAIAALA